ncbi:MAG: hypothetical protein R2882_06910 [Gemmatimonadales bacterium]
MVGQAAALGAVLTLLAAGLLRAVLGPAALTAAATFGALATVVHLAAALLVRRALAAGDYRALYTRWVAGTGLRLLGVAAIPVAVTIDRSLFPPLAAALGYIAVLVPLLFFEIRRFR